MACLDELSWPVRLFLRVYRWRRIDPIPWSPLEKPLPECRVALASSAGMVLPGMPPFEDAVRGGDPSFRLLPGELSVKELRETHRSDSFDRSALQQDPNMGFPLDRLRELERRGEIGAVAPRHLSFMGSITAPGRLVRDSAPRAVSALVEDRVDILLLVPV